MKDSDYGLRFLCDSVIYSVLSNYSLEKTPHVLLQSVYLDRIGRHVPHEVSTVRVVQHGHQSEGIPEKTIELVDVLGR